MTLKDLVKWAMVVEFGRPWRVITGDGWKLEQLWQNWNLQVERVTIAPNTEVVRHSHPDVDSWEYLQSGSGVLEIGHRLFVIDSKSPPVPLPIKRGVWHGGKTGPQGACWLSIQEWFIPVSSIDTNWEADDNTAKTKACHQ